MLITIACKALYVIPSYIVYHTVSLEEQPSFRVAGWILPDGIHPAEDRDHGSHCLTRFLHTSSRFARSTRDNPVGQSVGTLGQFRMLDGFGLSLAFLRPTSPLRGSEPFLDPIIFGYLFAVRKPTNRRITPWQSHRGSVLRARQRAL
jgi:hypothetical protein